MWSSHRRSNVSLAAPPMNVMSRIVSRTGWPRTVRIPAMSVSLMVRARLRPARGSGVKWSSGMRATSDAAITRNPIPPATMGTASPNAAPRSALLPIPSTAAK